MAKVYEIAFQLAGKVASGFNSSFKQANNTLAGFDKTLQSLQKEAANVSALTKQKESVARASQAYIQARQKVAALGQQMAKTKQPSKELQKEFNQAKLALDRSKVALDKNRTAMKQLQSSTGLTGKSLKDLTQRQKELAAATERTSKMQERQRKANSAWSGNKQTIADNAGYASAFGATLGAGITASVKTGLEFESAMSRVGAVSQASSGDLAKLNEQAKELGRSTVFSSSQAAEGMQYLAMAGFKTNDILAAMPGMLSLASAGQIELGSAADIASNILSGFGLEAGEIGKIGDVLTNTFTSSNTSLEGLGHTMKYAAPIAKSTGQSLELTAAMAGKLGDAGIQGEMAGTALRNVMLRLTTPTGNAAKTLEALGVSATDADGKIRPMGDVLADLSKATSSYSQEAQNNIASTIFGTESMGAAMILMEQAGSGALKKYEESLKTAGSANRVAEQQTNNLKGDMAGLSSAVEGAAITIYEVLQPSLRAITKAMTATVAKVQAWTKENPKLTRVLVGVATAIAGITAAALPLVAAFRTMKFTLALIKAPFLLFNKLLMAQKVQLIASRVALLAQAAAMKIWAVVTKAAAVVSKAITVAQWAMNAAMAANPIGLVIVAIGALIAIGVLLYKNWDVVKAKALELWETVKEAAVQMWESFKELLSYVGGKFKEGWENAWNGIKDFFGNLWNSLVDLAKKPLNGIIGMVNSVIGAINGISIDIPDWVPKFGGKTFGLSIPTIPQLASGGVATKSTLANIGEGREPEAVLPLSRLDNMLNSRGGGDISVNFAPVININGGGDAYAEVKRGLAEGQEALKRELARLLADQRRLAYY